MKPRRNPAVSEHTLTLYRTLHAAVERGVREILERGDGSAKCFQPLPATSRIGSVQQEMDIVRTCAGAWPRTDHPYQAVAPRMVDFLAFAYASERACRAAGETEAAEIWRFIRSVPKKATQTQNGYLQKGGVSRVLLSSRTMGEKPARCTFDMLTFAEPLDTLAFARSELWPVEKGAGTDGWTTIDKRVRAIRPMNAAWRIYVGVPASRPETPSARDVMRGLLGAGGSFSSYQYRSDLSSIDFRGANLTEARVAYATLKMADLSHTTLRKADLTMTTLYGANLNHADLTDAELSGTNLYESSLIGADLTGAWRSLGDHPIKGWSTRADGRNFRLVRE